MRTLNDIVPPSRRRESESVPLHRNHETGDMRNRPPKFPYTTIVTVLLIIAACAGALFYFSSAKVEVTPTTVAAEVQSSLTADTTKGDLPFQVISAEKIATQSVKSTGTESVSASASGMITIYNTQAKSQTLIANTRFATPAGLIFRIHAAVTVPSGSTAKPGTVSAKVYADKPGSSYNVGPTDFTIPGFAGTPLATEVYAKSTASMMGGALGNEPTVDGAAAAQVRTSLKAALAPDLEKSLAALIPEGYVLLPGSSSASYDDLSSEPSATSGQVTIREQGTITAVVFPNAALAKAIAGTIAGFGYQGEPLELMNASGLKLASENGIPGANATSFTFSLSGKASLVYTIDPTRIAAAVSGRTRQAAEVALTNYPEVKRAVIILRPFWRQTFPQDPAAIAIVLKNP